MLLEYGKRVDKYFSLFPFINREQGESTVAYAKKIKLGRYSFVGIGVIVHYIVVVVVGPCNR